MKGCIRARNRTILTDFHRSSANKFTGQFAIRVVIENSITPQFSSVDTLPCTFDGRFRYDYIQRSIQLMGETSSVRNAFSCVCQFLCVFVHALKGKRPEQSTRKSV